MFCRTLHRFSFMIVANYEYLVCIQNMEQAGSSTAQKGLLCTQKFKFHLNCLEHSIFTSLKSWWRFPLSFFLVHLAIRSCTFSFHEFLQGFFLVLEHYGCTVANFVFFCPKPTEAFLQSQWTLTLPFCLLNQLDQSVLKYFQIIILKLTIIQWVLNFSYI